MAEQFRLSNAELVNQVCSVSCWPSLNMWHLDVIFVIVVKLSVEEYS